MYVPKEEIGAKLEAKLSEGIQFAMLAAMRAQLGGERKSVLVVQRRR